MGEIDRRQMRFVLIAEDHVAVPVVVVTGCAGLSPLEARKGDQVFGAAVAAHGGTLPEHFLVFAPLTGGQGFRVICKRKKIQRRTIAGEIAGVRRRMGAGSAEHRQREDEGVPGDRAMHMQIAE